MKLDDPANHPVTRLVAVLADLESWHAGRGEREAAFEARLERERQLGSAFREPEDRQAIERDLEGRLPAMAGLPWYAMGQAQLAELLEGGPRPDRLVRAREAAQKGRQAYPESAGGKRCLSIVKRIEAPGYQLAAMKSDGPDRRSILVTHRNVARLTFRAYAIDLPARVASERDLRNILPQGKELERILAGRAAAQWPVALPATPDYLDHRTFVVPPMKAKGYYVVAASGDADFAAAGGLPVVASGFLVSDLVLVETPGAAPGRNVRQRLDVLALSGESGRPLDGVAVTVLKGRWNPTGTDRIAEAVTDRAGRAVLDFPADREWSQRFVFARRGEDLAVGTETPYGWRSEAAEGERTSSLVFTDRAIYRPLQKILWKVLAYRGDSREGRFRAFPKSAVTVTLYDANGQSVDTRSVTTNDFGTAAGEFAIPAGRALGAWRVATSLEGGGAMVRVEEYKRPTFEVTLKDSVEPLRLNRPARLSGEARYYFGLPVSAGNVRWSVTRTPNFPWWYGWRGFRTDVRTETIAVGTSGLQSDGSFTVAFTPKADERLADQQKGTTYSYTISADASDEGGETRSAARTFRLGFVAVEARIELTGGFLRAGAKEDVTVVRTNLDGAPRAGKGTWRLVRLQQPPAPLLPAELPIDPGEVPGGGYRTPGDSLRPRWQTGYSPDQVMAQWKGGAEVAFGEVNHDAAGVARIPIANLSPGAYRLLYRTRDEFGAEFEAPRELVVAGDRTPLALPALLRAEASSVPVGGTARLLATSGLPGQPLYFEIDRDGSPVERRTLVGGGSGALIEIPIREKDRGGFGVKLTMVRDHQLVVQTQSVFVPWDDKALKVSFSTFRDKLTPGQKETWTVKVERPDGAPVEPAAAELLANMYDRSLDAFAPYSPPSPLSVYPSHTQVWPGTSNLGGTDFAHVRGSFPVPPGYPPLRPDRLKFPGGYAFGGPGRRGVYAMAKSMDAAAPPASPEADSKVVGGLAQKINEAGVRPREEKAAAGAAAPAAIRADFSETAFWKPQLLTGPDGSASFEFTVPDSVTSWNVWVHAVTKDLQAGSVRKETRSVKELMVRPYVPRFLREGDLAELKVVVNNASERGFSGNVRLEILDTVSNASALAEFGLSPDRATLPFSAAAGAGADVAFRLTAPRRVGSYAIQATASAGDLSDGERRPVPVLPGRMQLAQSRFAALKGGERRTLAFADMAKTDDPSRIDEQLVVTVDGQLFYSVLSALPVPRELPLRVHRADAQPLPLDRASCRPSSATTRRSPRWRRNSRSATLGSSRGTATTPTGAWQLEETPWLEEAQGRQGRRRPVARPRPADREGRPRHGAREAPPGPDGLGRLPVVAGRAALDVHDPLHPERLRPRPGVRRRGPEGHGAGSAWRYAGAEIRRDLDSCMARKGTCEYVDVRQLRSVVLPRRVLVRARLRRRIPQDPSRLLLRALEGALAAI